jgi:hypothetical protein
MKALHGAALVAVVGAGMLAYGWHQRKIGERDAKIAALIHTQKQADSVYRVKISEWANEAIRYKNLRRTVRITDTVWVKQFIVAADSTIAACGNLVESCKHRVAVRDSIIEVLKKQKPRRFGCVVGGAVTPKGAGPGAACGLRL